MVLRTQEEQIAEVVQDVIETVHKGEIVGYEQLKKTAVEKIVQIKNNLNLADPEIQEAAKKGFNS